MDFRQRDLEAERMQIVNNSINRLSDEDQYLSNFVVKNYYNNYIMPNDRLHNDVFNNEYGLSDVRTFYAQCFDKENFIKKLRSKKDWLQQYGINYKEFKELTLTAIHHRIFEEYNIQKLKDYYDRFFNRKKFTEMIYDLLSHIRSKKERDANFKGILYDGPSNSIYDTRGFGQNYDDDDDDEDNETL